VNTTTPYEQLIAAKLDQVPVPDMADSIWSGIEAQLDAVVDAPQKKSSPKYKGKGWNGFFAVTATVVLVSVLWWYYSYKNHSPGNAAPAPKILPAPKESLPVKDSIKSIDNLKKKNTQVAPAHTEVAPVTQEKDTLPLIEIPVNNIELDSLFKEHLPPVKVDSSSIPKNNIIIPSPGSVNNKTTGKKPKGVKGITSNDYRLSVKKDSTGKP